MNNALVVHRWLVLAFSLLSWPAWCQELSSAPFHREQLVPCRTSRVVGSPDPPLPYHTEPFQADRVLPRLLYVTAEPGRNALLVVQQGTDQEPAIVARIPDRPDAVASADILAEIPQRVVYGLTFHPNYAQNGWLYAGSNGPVGQEERNNRISRFHVGTDGKIDRTSEVVVLEWRSMGHDGAALVFGHDGMLYITAGDGTSDSDGWQSAQDMTSLCGKVLRIDVDHPTSVAPYSIPHDNPFVQLPGARGEIWAIGLRNPWRMAVDRERGDIWVGNNGQDLWETAHLIRRGENYGWSVFEGSHPFYPNRTLGPAPYVAPTLEHHHRESRSLTGGEVYYGSQLPELQGCYIYGDYATGKIWGARHDGQSVVWHRELADTSLALVAFAVTPRGDLLLADYGRGLHRVVATPANTPHPHFPQTLSETGLFQSVAAHQMAEGVIPYQVNAPAWADGATAQRYVALPPGTAMQGTERRAWNLPNASVILQTLSLPDANQSLRRIETRMLHRTHDEWVGYTYLWNDAQTDATLVGPDGADITLQRSLTEPATSQPWRVPSRSECMSCHARAVGYLLGLTHVQMNRPCDYDGKMENQVDLLQRVGLLSPSPAQTTSTPSPLVNPYDANQSVSLRVRAYLHTNCSVCHVLTGGGNARMELEIDTADEKMNVIDAYPQHATFGIANARIVAPGHGEQSVLLERLTRRGSGQMPPLGVHQVDQAAVDLFRAWIEGLPATRPFVRDWHPDDFRDALGPPPDPIAASRGKLVFHEAGCSQCHRFLGEGGGAGPDLTNIGQRRQPAEILESMIFPSKTIAPEFATTILQTVDGRQWEGRIVREDDHVVVLRPNSAFTQPVDIPIAEIETRTLAPHSLMPAGLLNTWDSHQIVDLLSHLRQVVETPPPPERPTH